MKENKGKGLGCIYSPEDNFMYRQMKIARLQLKKRFINDPKEKEEIEKEIKRLKNYPSGIIK